MTDNNETPKSGQISHELMFADPDPAQSGMLLSDRIRFYVEHLRMIWPFHEGHLRPASYELTLGSEYLLNRGAKPASIQKLRAGEELVIPPNSIVFVSTEETITLPFYIAARFNVKVNLVYEGLLLGTGPQVDPGFRGRLSCPLHNISSQEIRLHVGESFAIIDFEKTTTFAQAEDSLGDYSLDEIRKRGSENGLRGFRGFPALTYPAERLDRPAISGLLPRNKSVASSLTGIEDRVSNAEKTILDEQKKIDSAINRLNVTLIVSLLTVLLSISAFFWQSVNWARSMRDDAKSMVNDVRSSTADYKQLRDRISALETEIKELQATRHPAVPSRSTAK